MLARHARREAEARLGGRYRARVLEPSPPPVTDPPWFADDPVARGEDDGRPVVSPVTTGDVLWEDVARDDARLAEWSAQRWLGPYRRLPAPPPDLTATRVALHRVAEEVLAPARQRATGKIGLRWTRGGFGTPFFDADVQLRVFEGHLVQQASDREQSRPIAGVHRAAAHWFGEFYGFATSVLEQLRAEAPQADQDASRVQLWPEHFDMAVDVRAATYGFSPGDPQHETPYLYVLPGSPTAGHPDLWTATAFSGAILPFADILDAVDQRGEALRFLRERRDALG